MFLVWLWLHSRRRRLRRRPDASVSVGTGALVPQPQGSVQVWAYDAGRSPSLGLWKDCPGERVLCLSWRGQMVSSQRCVCHRSCLVEEALLNVESDADVREMWKGLSFICYMHPLESRVHRCEMKKALVKQI